MFREEIAEARELIELWGKGPEHPLYNADAVWDASRRAAAHTAHWQDDPNYHKEGQRLHGEAYRLAYSAAAKLHYKHGSDVYSNKEYMGLADIARRHQDGLTLHDRARSRLAAGMPPESRPKPKAWTGMDMESVGLRRKGS